MREHDAFALELGTVRHERAIRDVRRVVGVEERRVADEDIGTVRDAGQLLAPDRVARIRDELVTHAHPQTVRIRLGHVLHRQRAHERAPELDLVRAEHRLLDPECELRLTEEIGVER